MDGEPQIFLENMGDMVFAHIELAAETFQGQILLYVVLDKTAETLIEGFGLLFLLGMIPFVDQTVNMQDQVVDAQGDLRLPTEAVRLHLLQKSQNLGLNGIKGNFVIVKNIVLSGLNQLHQVAVIRREVKEMTAELLTDPEDETPVGQIHAVDYCHMGEPGRNHDQIPGHKGVDLTVNLYAHVSLQKKIKFIVVMRVQQHLRAGGVIVIVKLKILRKHILPGAELSL